MKIHDLYVDGYKNLHAIRLHLDSERSVCALIGGNGCGKSNLLEALTLLFAAAMQGEDVPFRYEVGYTHGGAEFRLSNLEGSMRFCRDGQELSPEARREALPECLFLYYGGETARLRRLSAAYRDPLYDAAVQGDGPPMLKFLSYIGLRDFPVALLANAAYRTPIYEQICDMLKVDELGASFCLSLRLPWEEMEEPAWEARLTDQPGDIGATLRILLQAGDLQVKRPGYAELWIPQEALQVLDDTTPYDLYCRLHLLMQADVVDELDFSVGKEGAYLTLEELSEGEKQLAHLLCLFGVTNDRRVLFLLDEFDVFLHPGWQRIFAQRIAEIELAGQVLFTTHSPLTLGKLQKSAIRLLRNGEVFEPSADPFNRDVTEVMEELLGVEKRPVEVLRVIDAFRAAIQSGQKEEAYAQLGRLHTLLTAEDPFWITAEHQMARLERLS